MTLNPKRRRRRAEPAERWGYARALRRPPTGAQSPNDPPVPHPRHPGAAEAATTLHTLSSPASYPRNARPATKLSCATIDRNPRLLTMAFFGMDRRGFKFLLFVVLLFTFSGVAQFLHDNLEHAPARGAVADLHACRPDDPTEEIPSPHSLPIADHNTPRPVHDSHPGTPQDRDHCTTCHMLASAAGLPSLPPTVICLDIPTILLLQHYPLNLPQVDRLDSSAARAPPVFA